MKVFIVLMIEQTGLNDMTIVQKVFDSRDKAEHFMAKFTLTMKAFGGRNILRIIEREVE